MTPWTAACQASLSSSISWNLLKFISIELVILSNHPILCHSLLLLPSIFPSIRVFSNELALHIRWSKYWGFSISLLYNGWQSCINTVRVFPEENLLVLIFSSKHRKKPGERWSEMQQGIWTEHQHCPSSLANKLSSLFVQQVSWNTFYHSPFGFQLECHCLRNTLPNF